VTTDHPIPDFGGRLGWGASPALVLIDLMRAYFTPSSPLDLGSSAAVEASSRLLASARDHGVPVIHTAVHYRAGAVDAGLFVRKVGALALLADDHPDNLRELMPQVAPLDAETVIIKQYASAFFGTSLASTLRALGIDTVVLAGVSTSGCIRASATDALQHGFRPMVVADACADRTDELHRSNLRDLRAKYADIVAVDEVLRRFAGADQGA
jgi:maleamate amidohydrolase